MLRRSPLTRSPMKRTRPKRCPAEVRTRRVVAKRSGGLCEMNLSGCTRWATDTAHRVAVGMGGKPLDNDWRPSNVVHACRTCHSWCHARPTEAYDLGLMLKQHQEPMAEPMAYQNAGWVVLADDGTLWPAGEAA